jgi:Uma2 family endonuclease
MLEFMETVDLEQFKGEQIRRLRVDEYERLITAGAFEDEPVELLEGLLVEMSPIGVPHTLIVAKLMRMLVLATQKLPVLVIPQGGIRMGDYSMPEPDICVASKPSKMIRPSGGLLVVEVSDSSLKKDRELKRDVYAKAGVHEYWVVDVNHDCVHVHTDPLGGAYTMVTVASRDAVLRPLELAGVTISVDEMFDPTR